MRYLHPRMRSGKCVFDRKTRREPGAIGLQFPPKVTSTQALINHEPCLALPVSSMYSNPRNIWQHPAAEASPPHHEEEISM